MGLDLISPTQFQFVSPECARGIAVATDHRRIRRGGFLFHWYLWTRRCKTPYRIFDHYRAHHEECIKSLTQAHNEDRQSVILPRYPTPPMNYVCTIVLSPSCLICIGSFVCSSCLVTVAGETGIDSLPSYTLSIPDL